MIHVHQYPQQPESFQSPRIQVAQQVLTYIQGVRFSHAACRSPGDVPTSANLLTPDEARVYSAALQLLHRYLLGEIDLGDEPICQIDEEDESEDGERQPDPFRPKPPDTKTRVIL